MVYRPESLLERLELLRQYGADLTQWRDLSGRLPAEPHHEVRGGALALPRGFRNVLAHEYVGLADTTVHEHLVKMNGVFRALTRELEMLVESGDAG